jgi:hypothetical protein
LTIAHVDERKLVSWVKAQGLEVIDKPSGKQVRNPKTGQITGWHTSSLNSNNHTYMNIIRDLYEIGFVDPDTYKREYKHRLDEPLSCEWPDCGRQFWMKAHYVRHRKYTHGIGLEPKPEPPVEGTPEEVLVGAADVVREVKPDPHRELKLAVGRLQRAYKTMDELLPVVVKQLIAAQDENEDLKRKLKKVEEIMGKAIEYL